MLRDLISKYSHELLKFLRSTDFSKAIVLTVAMIIPIGLFSYLGYQEIGVSVAMGCLFSAPSDVPGSLKNRYIGIFFAAILGAVSFFISGYLQFDLLMILPMLLVMVFGISFLSVFGFRASLISFAGLMAVVLSFANLSSGIEIWLKSLLIFTGGIWYLVLSLSWNFIKPNRAIEQLLAETMELTAEYLQLRVQLYHIDIDPSEIQQQLFSKQIEINEHHENLRNILISERERSGKSGYIRQRLLVFIELVDMLELAMANPLDYDSMKKNLSAHRSRLVVFSNFSLNLAENLTSISNSIFTKSKLPENNLSNAFKKVQECFESLKSSVDLTKEREAIIILRNLLDYQQKQVQKFTNIHRLLSNLENGDALTYNAKQVKKFITPEEYSFKILLANFNFESTIFRHSLRLSIIIIAGFMVGDFFDFQNSYWILLTIIVIMRPNYGLTKERTKKRIIGTFIGGAIAIAVVFLIQNSTVYAVLAMLSLTFAFSLLQRNYTTAAIFITLSIIFIYALLRPDVMDVIQFRIIDTLVGAALAGVGNLILWPKWEQQGIKHIMMESIRANMDFLTEVDWYYHRKGELPVSYKLKRKKAMLEVGNLSGAFQRMTQEPKSKQKFSSDLYEIVELNQSFLSALASMGAYIRNHHTTKASEDFETYTKTITINLLNALNDLEGKQNVEIDKSEVLSAASSLKKRFQNLSEKRNLEIESGKLEIDDISRQKLQEVHLITGQLEWLLSLSERILEKTSKLKINNE